LEYSLEVLSLLLLVLECTPGLETFGFALNVDAVCALVLAII
jgi:predicted exporter